MLHSPRRGGIKVNAFAVVVLNLVAVLRSTERVEVFGRELSYDSILPFQCDLVMSISVLFVFVFILTIWEPQASVMALLFECVSALSTVGSSLNLTPTLGDNSKLLVAFLMFIGRGTDYSDVGYHQAKETYEISVSEWADHYKLVVSSKNRKL